MLPRTDNVFFTESLVIVAVAVFAGQLALTLVHEAFHVLAGRRLGIRSRVRISRRMYFVVFETNLDGLAVVERRRRYLPILAGLLADALAVAGLTVLAYLTREWTVVSGLCLALGVHHAAAHGVAVLPLPAHRHLPPDRDRDGLRGPRRGGAGADRQPRQRAARAARAPARQRAWGPRDLKLARWYAPLLVIGYAWMLAVLALVLVPLLLRFWESALLLALTLSQLAVALAIALRERRANRRKTT